MDQDWLQHQGAKRYSALDLDLVTELPGIYAWYAHLPLSTSDWKKNVIDDVDRAPGHLIEAISSYSRMHQETPIQITGTGSYGLPWRGHIARETIFNQRDNHSPSRIQARLDATSKSPDSRQALAAMLKLAVPTFSSPLYVGVAGNLRTRLTDHRAHYSQTRDQINNDPSLSNKFQFDGDNFGERLAGSGILLDRLECWVLPIDVSKMGIKLSPKEIRTVAEDAEWVLQRVFHPTLGRK